MLNSIAWSYDRIVWYDLMIEYAKLIMVILQYLILLV